jgi:hypothetical protein
MRKELWSTGIALAIIKSWISLRRAKRYPEKQLASPVHGIWTVGRVLDSRPRNGHLPLPDQPEATTLGCIAPRSDGQLQSHQIMELLRNYSTISLPSYEEYADANQAVSDLITNLQTRSPNMRYLEEHIL